MLNRILHKRLKHNFQDRFPIEPFVRYLNLIVEQGSIAALLNRHILLHMRDFFLQRRNGIPFIQTKLEHAGQRQYHCTNILVIA
ncbi:hypothetical protein D3C84_1191590 [compost metagenome]